MQKKHTKSDKEIKAEPIHVRLNKPTTLRKALLGASIDVTRMLKTYAELKEIKEMKADLFNSYQDINSDINKLVRHLEKNGLPPVFFKEFEHEEVKIEKKEPFVKEKVVDSEIERLKSELADIERKLGNL